LKRIFFRIASLLALTACISPQPKLYQTDTRSKAATSDTTSVAAKTPPPAPIQTVPVLPAQNKTEQELLAQFIEGEIEIHILVSVGESYPALGKRILHHPEDWHLLPLPSSSTSASYIKVPFAFLNYAYMKRALLLVFPKDAETDSSWTHAVTYANETWATTANIFSAEVDYVDLLLQENGFEEEDDVRLGQVIKIPDRFLCESLRRFPLVVTPEIKPAPQESEPSRPVKPPHSQDPELRLVTRAGKTFGVYRLKRGEALYSAVVVRFTGRVDAEEVNQIAKELMASNGIADASRIAVGTEIKIPLALIDEALLGEESAAAVPAPTPRRGRSLHVILDAGHGGNDPGTMTRSLREDEIAYDLMRRIQTGLTSKGVQVHPLVSTNGRVTMSNGHARNSRHEYVNVTPAYYLKDGRIGLNLRIYLVDTIYRKLLREGVAAENILFMSIHLDHLHPSVGGTMIYIPGAKERAAKFKASEEIFDKYQESRDRMIHFPTKENRQAENASWAFSQAMIASLRKAKLPVHAYKPVRKYVYRGGKKWTPGIIRYNRVPTAVLIEAANFSNPGDQKRIRTTQFRQQLADTIVRAIVAGK